MSQNKILLVDDDPEDRMIVQDGLKELGADNLLEFAENGEVALALLGKHALQGTLPGLVVLDLNMPKMNGTQILKALKEDPRFRHIPVIIYSTSINPLEKDRCLQLGAHSYIIKPVSFQESIDTARLFMDFCRSNS
ncbi:MAG: response regulator [Bacteroidetes bacterium]|nr:response regulator [Bacteroidota bacterium]